MFDAEYETLQDEIAIEGRREWDREAQAMRDEGEPACLNCGDTGFLDNGDECPFCYAFENLNLDDEDYDDSMDGDFDSAMSSAGLGTDEDYGYYGGREDY